MFESLKADSLLQGFPENIKAEHILQGNATVQTLRYLHKQ